MSKNENGIPAWKLVLSDDKIVTRRAKPVEVGKIRAVQPNRCEKAVGYIKILSCRKHDEWWEDMMDTNCFFEVDMEHEAIKEGFLSWNGLNEWFKDKGYEINDTYRIEFELLPDGDGKPSQVDNNR